MLLVIEFQGHHRNSIQFHVATPLIRCTEPALDSPCAASRFDFRAPPPPDSPSDLEKLFVCLSVVVVVAVCVFLYAYVCVCMFFFHNSLPVRPKRLDDFLCACTYVRVYVYAVLVAGRLKLRASP